MTISDFSQLMTGVDLSAFEVNSDGLPAGNYIGIIKEVKVNKEAKFGPQLEIKYELSSEANKIDKRPITEFLPLPSGNPAQWKTTPEIGSNGREFIERDVMQRRGNNLLTRFVSLGAPRETAGQVDPKTFEGYPVSVRIWVHKETGRSNIGTVALRKIEAPSQVTQQTQQPQQVVSGTIQPSVGVSAVNTAQPATTTPPFDLGATGGGNPFAV